MDEEYRAPPAKTVPASIAASRSGVGESSN
jgi:hypothetical protein